MATVHIESKLEDIAGVVLMPGDPMRARYIADRYLSDYQLVNGVRGMTAYTGYYKGTRVTVFPSGMGCPSMGIYSYELFKFYNVDKIIRIGSCGGYDDSLELRSVILATESYSNSNYANELGGYRYQVVKADDDLNEVISNTAYELGINLFKRRVFCSDAFYENEFDYHKRMDEMGVVGVEMETFALFSNALKLNKKASAILTVSDKFGSSKQLSSEEREKSLDEMIILALESCLKL